MPVPTVIEKAWLTDPTGLDAVIVKEYEDGEVGVPVNAPVDELRDIPAGSEPDVTE
jgi:hypothetical protein